MVSSVVANLRPATKGDVMIYQPYYAKAKQDVLPLAISLYQKGSFEGERMIEDEDNIPFVATWFISRLPSDPTRCTLQFAGQADLSYQVNMSNSDLIKHLLEVIENYRRHEVADFSQEFYRQLLQVG